VTGRAKADAEVTLKAPETTFTGGILEGLELLLPF
jgi:hypothetical protein